MASCIIHPSKIHLGKNISQVEHKTDCVIAHCSDGSKYEGDVIVGADGVHSFVRSEMWRVSDTINPGLIPDKERNSKFSNTHCRHCWSMLTTSRRYSRILLYLWYLKASSAIESRAL